jgi:hypothetical protein
MARNTIPHVLGRRSRPKWLRAAAALVLWVGGGNLSELAIAQVTSSTVSPAPVNSTHMLNKHTIQLPIQLEERFRPLVKEIQLYYKEQLSAPWTLRDKAPPTQGSFTFKASHDGEYWFMMATIDRKGQCVPSDIAREEPAMSVVLDTQAPQCEFAFLGAVPEGQLIQCDVHDAHPDPARTRVQYQTADRVFHDMEALPDRPNVYCIPAQANITGQVRASVADLAGNRGTKECAIGQLPKAPTAHAALAKSSASSAPASSAPPAALNFDREQKLTGPQLALPEEANVPADAHATPAKQATPVSMPTALPNAAPSSAAPRPLGSGVSAAPPVDRTVPQGPPLPAALAIQPAGGAPATAAPIQTVSALAPPSDSCALVKNADAVQPAGPATTIAPKHEGGSTHPVLVNNRRVFLEYRIEQQGPSGVGRVEIWCTHDHGQTWKKLGEHRDGSSPAEALLPADGVYGLSLVVSNGLGFGAQPPITGDTPDWWVEVDTVQPTAQLTEVRMARQDGPAVEIGWTSQDRNLGTAPVELAYAVTRQGPWVPIAKGLKGDGQYRWVPPADIGQQAFLRLTVRDLAGNTTTTETTQPVALDDLSRPRAYIAGISTEGGVTPAPKR